MSELLSLPLVPVVLTLLCYQAGALLQKRLKTPICNPILVGVALVVVFLNVSGMELETYQAGMKSLSWLLTPATVCLAIPMYEQFQALKKSIKAIVLGIAAGTVTSVVVVWAMCVLFGFSDALTLTLLPKSVTSAIGAPLAEMAGGMGAVSTAVIIITGIVGGILGELFCKIFRITDPIAQGVAYGTASHVVGTAKANDLSPLIGAVSSLSLVVAGLMTSVVLPFVFPYV